jgi:hypothetical protein
MLTILSCRTFAANAVRLQLHVLAYNLGNFMRTLAMPKTAEPWSLTSLTHCDGEGRVRSSAALSSFGRCATCAGQAAITRRQYSRPDYFPC